MDPAHFVPAVHFQDTAQHSSSEEKLASPEYMAAILAAYADMEVLSVNQDAKTLAAPLVPQELAAYVHAVYEDWLVQGAEEKSAGYSTPQRFTAMRR